MLSDSEIPNVISVSSGLASVVSALNSRILVTVAACLHGGVGAWCAFGKKLSLQDDCLLGAVGHQVVGGSVIQNVVGGEVRVFCGLGECRRTGRVRVTVAGTPSW